MSRKIIPAIPEPQPTLDELYNAVMALKQAVEIMTGQRQPLTNASPTWQDLVDLGLLTEDEVPKINDPL